MTLYTQVSSNRRKTAYFLFIYGLLILAIGYAASYYFNSPAILVFAAILTIGQGIASYWYSDSISLAVSGAVPLAESSPATVQRVQRIVDNLCITAGLPKPRIYIIPDSAMNAFATGRDPEHAALALTAGLVDRLNDNEIAGVVAHELSHVGNEDIRLMSMVSIMAGLIALLSDWMMRSFFWGGRRRDDENSGGGYMMIIALVLAILAPIAATLIQLAISRKREFMADADAVLLTRYPEGLISALKKISGDTEPLEAANRATAHMYIANPLKGDAISKLFSTHPPVEERILALEKGSGLAK